jgi:hypothetical protein
MINKLHTLRTIKTHVQFCVKIRHENVATMQKKGRGITYNLLQSNEEKEQFEDEPIQLLDKI